ncbi:uncharacterized protein LOC100844176 [Brachypodium distachyon]|uniref:Uncharacterized protein n=1 Tax=Brachypodium distachyon TaxID=15368 RepID=I1HPQ2_BRADI|nr:uncharacterized protein LOC100844176 [Brachypodium distachyon]KQK08866.1 hypothetical protein BRADI_2g44410v3 [Brachypodium distachyon]|eukprot:XP_003569412.1 uncharacterized protein LOC100844176 [Brachypodium distachyon]
MARGKVREWIRKRAMPRKASSAAGRWSSSASGASSPILGEAAANGAAAAAPVTSKVRAVSALSTALRWRLRVNNVLAALYEKVVYHLLWLVESVVMVSRLCFFLMRFGFKQL